jgi:hypothetical protein
MDTEDWKSFVRELDSASIQVSNEIWSKLSYAQDTCLVLDSQSRLLSSKSIVTEKCRGCSYEVEKLLKSAGLKIKRPEESFNFDGGNEVSKKDAKI